MTVQLISRLPMPQQTTLIVSTVAVVTLVCVLALAYHLLDQTSSSLQQERLTQGNDSDVPFLKIFSHDTAGGLFPTPDAALRWNPSDPTADLFSILDQLESYRNTEGKFHLKLCYPDVTTIDGGHCNEWMQTSNPVAEGNITGFEVISLAFTKDGAEQSWHGLGKSSEYNGENPSLIDDTGSNPYWWCAIGATRYHGHPLAVPRTIPGPWQANVRKVELYVFHSYKA